MDIKFFRGIRLTYSMTDHAALSGGGGGTLGSPGIRRMLGTGGYTTDSPRCES